MKDEWGVGNGTADAVSLGGEWGVGSGEWGMEQRMPYRSVGSGEWGISLKYDRNRSSSRITN